MAWTERAHQRLRPPIMDKCAGAAFVGYYDAQMMTVWLGATRRYDFFSDTSLEQDRGVLCWCTDTFVPRWPCHTWRRRTRSRGCSWSSSRPSGSNTTTSELLLAFAGATTRSVASTGSAKAPPTAPRCVMSEQKRE